MLVTCELDNILNHSKELVTIEDSCLGAKRFPMILQTTIDHVILPLNHEAGIPCLFQGLNAFTPSPALRHQVCHVHVGR